jgi:SAM-dependent methyltransferase
MAEQQIRFEDGAAYERMMGAWSRTTGGVFLDWLAPSPGLRWVDIGCGSGAFSELLVERCMPTEVQGVDPSEGQLAFAQTRPAARLAQFRQGDAMALPFRNGSFDAAVMALVIFFVPEPAKGVGEMVRVVTPGAWSRPMPGMSKAADVLRSRSTPKCVGWASPCRCRRVSRGVANGSLAGAVDRRWPRGDRDARLVQREFRRFRRFLMTTVTSASVAPVMAAHGRRRCGEAQRTGARAPRQAALQAVSPMAHAPMR